MGYLSNVLPKSLKFDLSGEKKPGFDKNCPDKGNQTGKFNAVNSAFSGDISYTDLYQ